MAKKKAKRKPPAPKSKPKSKAKPKPRPKTRTKSKTRSTPRATAKKKTKPKTKSVKRPAKTTKPASKSRAPVRKIPVSVKPAAKAPTPQRVPPPAPPVATTVEEYIRALPAWQAEVARALRDIIHTAAPNSSESIRGGQPVYEEDGPICYFKAFSDHVTFGFWRGIEMPDPSNLLKGGGDRMRHVRLTMFDDVPREPLEEFVRNAVRLNREKGNPAFGR